MCIYFLKLFPYLNFILISEVINVISILMSGTVHKKFENSNRVIKKKLTIKIIRKNEFDYFK